MVRFLAESLVEPLLDDYEMMNPDGAGLGLWVVHSSKKRPLRGQLFAQFAVQHLRASLTVKELECEISDPPLDTSGDSARHS